MVATAPYRKKLLEVVLPLEAINTESLGGKQKAPEGFPTSFHKWWAQRPLAACHAVVFASLVDDPSSWPDLFPTKADQDAERHRIFDIMEELINWDRSKSAGVLYNARQEIVRSISRDRGEPMLEGEDAIKKYFSEHVPPVLDPLCGAGSIPIEVQRLGLEALVSDHNPVAVLVIKALLHLGGDNFEVPKPKGTKIDF